MLLGYFDVPFFHLRIINILNFCLKKKTKTKKNVFKMSNGLPRKMFILGKGANACIYTLTHQYRSQSKHIFQCNTEIAIMQDIFCMHGHYFQRSLT